MSKSIFISHNHYDKPFVRRLAKDLHANGIRVWVDEAEIIVGDSLLDKIQIAIQEMDYLGIVLSRNSANSNWVKKEVEMAMTKEIRDRKVIVLPLLLEDVKLPLFLESKLYADFRKESNYATSVEQLLARLGIKNPVITSSILKDNVSFEILGTNVKIQLNDEEGKNVDYLKSEFIRLKEKGLIEIPEEAGGDGEQINFFVNPGEIQQIRKEEGLYRMNTLIQCQKPDEIIQREYGWKIINGFTSSKEYWLFKHLYTTPYCEIEIIFPPNRPPKSVTGSVRIGMIDKPYNKQPVIIIKDNHAIISWKLETPSDKDMFRLDWNW